MKSLFEEKSHKARASLIASIFISISSSYAQVPTTPHKTERMGEVLKQPEIQPFPIPTQEQLQRGQDVLDKISYVAAHIPLTDGSAVLQGFGYAYTHIEKYPNYILMSPGNELGDLFGIENMRETNFISMMVIPSMANPDPRSIAYVFGEFNVKKVCVTLGALKKIFSNIDHLIIGPIITTDPLPRPPALNDVGYIGLSKLLTPLGLNGAITFSFWNQTCAEDFTFSYSSN